MSAVKKTLPLPLPLNSKDIPATSLADVVRSQHEKMRANMPYFGFSGKQIRLAKEEAELLSQY